MKAIAIISGVIFLAITIAAVVIIYQTGLPFIKRVQSSVIIDQIENMFVRLNEVIKEVASEGRAAQRSISLALDSGEITADSANDIISWDFETDALLISPRTVQQIDNLKVGSNLESSAYEGTYASQDAYVLENEHLLVFIKKIGTQNAMQPYGTSDLLLGIHNKDIDQDLPLQRLEILIDGGNSTGTGFTSLAQSGQNLPYATAIAFLNPDDSPINFNISFTLESGADFVTVGGSL